MKGIFMAFLANKMNREIKFRGKSIYTVKNGYMALLLRLKRIDMLSSRI